MCVVLDLSLKAKFHTISLLLQNMTSYLGGGLASLDRWEGLKEWHRRHQDLLGGSSSDSVIEGMYFQYASGQETVVKCSSKSYFD